MRADPVRLGIDFGTSSTVAVVSQPDGQVRPLLFGETPILPSAVCVDWRSSEPAFLIGRDAIHAGRAHPDSFEPNPKLRIDDGSVLLGASDLPVTELIGAVLRRVGTEAERVAGAPASQVTLTYPASWGPRRRSVLQEAARIAGMPEPAMVAEPVAAAAYFVDALARSVPVGQCVVVYDFGAGTFDASVVGRTDEGFTVLAEEGLRDAGGLDIDNSVVAYFGATYGVTDGASWRRLTHPETPADRRVSRHFWDDIRTGKEMLSRAASTSIYLPLVETDALLGREQLEHLARPLLDRTVAATAAAIRAAQVDASRIAGVFLVGGSSRIPLAATLLHRTLGIAPTIIEQPELVVAGGSLIATATAQSLPTAPVSPAAMSASVPVSPAARLSGSVVSGSAAVPAAVESATVPNGGAGQGAAPTYTLPSSEVPSTFEHAGPSPWEQTPAAPFAAAPTSPPVGMAPTAPPMSTAPMSPAPGPAPVAPVVGHFAAAPVSAAPMSAAPVSAAPMSAAPVSAAPMSAAPISAAPMSGAPVSAAPMSGAPLSAGPVSAPPVSAPPVNAPPVSAPPVSAPSGPAQDNAWPPVAPFFAAPPAAPPMAPGVGAPVVSAVPGGVAAVRGVGIAVAVTTLLRFVLMFGDSGPASLVRNIGFEPYFDYLAIALLVVLGGWLAVRPAQSRVLAVLGGVAPWAMLPIVADIVTVARYFDWTDEYPLIWPMLLAQLLALFAAGWLVCRAALRERTAPRLLPLGLAAVAGWTPVAALLLLNSSGFDVVAAGQVLRVGLAVGVGVGVVYAAAGARAWAGWTVGAWIGGALLWMIGAVSGHRAADSAAEPVVLLILLVVVAVALLVVLLRTDRGAPRPHAGLAKRPAFVALIAVAIAAAGFALVLIEQVERWSYNANPNIVASVFTVASPILMLLGGVLLLVVRRSAGAAAYCVGTAAGPVSALASPNVGAFSWQYGSGLVLFGVAALVLVAVLIRSAPTRLSWPYLAASAGCLLMILWAVTGDPYNYLGRDNQWLVILVLAAVPATIVWKGGLVTAGVLFGAAAGTIGDQFLTLYRKFDDGSVVLLAFALLATLATGLLIARSTPDPAA